MSPLVKPFSFLLEKSAVPMAFVLGGVRHEIECPHSEPAAPARTVAQPPDWTPPDEPTRAVALIALAWARSGDKGNLSNIGLIARRPEWLPMLRALVTPEAVGRHLAHLVRGPVERYDVVGVDAMNFVLHDALDGGGPSSMRMDPLGKGMAQMLLDMLVQVPCSIADRH